MMIIIFFSLEVNTIPGMTAHSIAPLTAHTAGISYNELCINMLNDAKVYL